MAAETLPGCYRGPILIKYIFVILLQLQGKASAELGATTNEIKYFWMWVSAYRTLYLYLFGYHLELTAPSWYQDPLLPPGLNVRRAHPAKANAPHLRTSLQSYIKGCQRPGGKPQRGWSTHSEWRGNRAYIWKRDHFHSWTLLFFPPQECNYVTHNSMTTSDSFSKSSLLNSQNKWNLIQQLTEIKEY